MKQATWLRTKLSHKVEVYLARRTPKSKYYNKAQLSALLIININLIIINGSVNNCNKFAIFSDSTFLCFTYSWRFYHLSLLLQVLCRFHRDCNIKISNFPHCIGAIDGKHKKLNLCIPDHYTKTTNTIFQLCYQLFMLKITILLI